MLNNDDFIEEYISECILRGICSTKEICAEAKKEMTELDKKITETNILRVRYKNLSQVLKNFNYDSSRKKPAESVLNVSSGLEDSVYYEMMAKICHFIDKAHRLCTSRDVQNHIGGLENNSEVYLCIKELADRGIISRDDNRCIIKGAKWSDRPVIILNKTA